MITSPNNPRISSVAALRKRRARDTQRLFIVEGARPLGRAIAAGWPIVEVFYVRETVSESVSAVVDAAVAADIAITEVGDRALAKMAYRSDPEGVLGVAEYGAFSVHHMQVVPGGLYLVTEAVEKPGNIGAMLRTAEATGVAGLITADSGTDLTNPNVVRASQGSLFSVPTAAASASEVRSWLDTNAIPAIAATPDDGGQTLWDVDLTGGVAVVIGSEHAGVSAKWDDVGRLSIPMSGTADSLNAATSAAVIMFEAVRQRRRSADTSKPS